MFGEHWSKRLLTVVLGLARTGPYILLNYAFPSALHDASYIIQPEPPDNRETQDRFWKAQTNQLQQK